MLLRCCVAVGCVSNEQVKPEARSNLRKFRSQAGIDAQEHLLAIQKQVCCWLGTMHDRGLLLRLLLLEASFVFYDASAAGVSRCSLILSTGRELT